MFVYHSHSLSGRIKLEPDSEPDSTEKLAILPILRFSKSIFAELGDSNTLFWLDCQSSYNTVALYAVWRNLDQNWHFRGDLNIKVCRKLRHKKLIDQSCWSDTWSSVSSFIFFRYPKFCRCWVTLVLFDCTFCLTTLVQNIHMIVKIEKNFYFSKIQIPIKLVQNT